MNRRELFETIPDPWRGWIGMRRGRRWLRAVRFARRHNAGLPADGRRVAFYPMRLEPTAALAFVLARLGARIVDFGRPADLTVAWETGTWLRAVDAERLPAGALNRRCVDISKRVVDRAWAEASGYSIAVDPLTTAGPIVIKPVRNAVRGGRIVDGPLRQRRTDCVYQRLIDSRAGDEIRSTRAVIVNGRIVVAYDKRRPYPNWFNGPEVNLPVRADEVYTADEQRVLLRFADEIGLDYGELDVLRDNESGLIYVVDANRTPVRPKGLPAESEEATFGPMAAGFGDLLKRG